MAIHWSFSYLRTWILSYGCNSKSPWSLTSKAYKAVAVQRTPGAPYAGGGPGGGGCCCTGAFSFNDVLENWFVGGEYGAGGGTIGCWIGGGGGAVCCTGSGTGAGWGGCGCDSCRDCSPASRPRIDDSCWGVISDSSARNLSSWPRKRDQVSTDDAVYGLACGDGKPTVSTVRRDRLAMAAVKLSPDMVMGRWTQMNDPCRI